MKISLASKQLEIFYSGLENLADAVKVGNGNVTDEKMDAILEYIGLEKNEKTIRETKICIRIFSDVFNNHDADRQASIEKITSIGISLKHAIPVVDILLGTKSATQMEQLVNESKYHFTDAGRFSLNMTVDDLLKARELLKRFEHGNSLGNNELEYLLDNYLLEKYFPLKKERKYYVTNAGKFLFNIEINDLGEARELLKRFNSGDALSKNELEYLLNNDLLDYP